MKDLLKKATIDRRLLTQLEVSMRQAGSQPAESDDENRCGTTPTRSSRKNSSAQRDSNKSSTRATSQLHDDEDDDLDDADVDVEAGEF